jgi:hypothetical protein
VLPRAQLRLGCSSEALKIAVFVLARNLAFSTAIADWAAKASTSRMISGEKMPG